MVKPGESVPVISIDQSFADTAVVQSNVAGTDEIMESVDAHTKDHYSLRGSNHLESTSSITEKSKETMLRKRFIAPNSANHRASTSATSRQFAPVQQSTPSTVHETPAEQSDNNTPPPFGGSSQVKTSFKASPASVEPVLKEGKEASSLYDKIFALDSISGYKGGQVALLYEGRMLIHSVGSFLVVTDLDRENTSRPTIGLWKIFSSTANAPREDNVYSNAILKGHQNEIGLIEVSPTDRWLATVESSCEDGMVCLLSFGVY